MKLNRFNEAIALKNGETLYNKEEALQMKFFIAVYPDLIEDLKELLDTTFVDFIDKEYEVAIVKVNSKFLGTFFTRYRINMNYTVESKEDNFNSIENYSTIMSSVSEDLLNLNACVTHIKDEYEDVSIFGDEFPKNRFETSVKMSMAAGKLVVNFTLDIR